MGRGGDWMGEKEKEGDRVGREGKREGMWRGPESGLPRGPCWLSAGLAKTNSVGLLHLLLLILYFNDGASKVCNVFRVMLLFTLVG